MKLKFMSIITLVGMMGCGKTTVGQQLASNHNKRYFDTDSIIEEVKPIEDIFTNKGEGYFRQLEHKVIANLLDSYDDCIISLGGGAFIENKTRKLLVQKTLTIWLKVNFNTIMHRTQGKNSRPLVGLLNKEFFNWRSNIYKQAESHIDCDNLTPYEIAQKICLLNTI